MKSFKFTVPTFSVLVLGTVLLFSACGKDEDSTPARDKFFGTYDATETCTSGQYAYSMTIKESTQGEDIILIDNFGDYGVIVEATVNNDVFSIEKLVNTSVGPVLITGNGSINSGGTLLTITYNVSGDQCTATCIKI